MNKETDFFDLKIFTNRIEEFLLKEFINIILIVLIYILVSWLLNKIFRGLKNRLNTRYEASGDNEGRKRMITLVRLIKSFIRIGLISILLLVLFSEIGLDIIPLIAGVGIVGIAVGFGSQELIRDIISGLFIILENKIRIGDVVTINGTRGLVEKIELKGESMRKKRSKREL